MIFIVEDDLVMAECIAKACQPHSVKIFPDAIAAVSALSKPLPKLIFLDILLTGPDGFTLLHELASYQDSAQIPVVIVSSLDLKNHDLSAYGVVGILDKCQMTPSDIKFYVQKYLNKQSSTHA